MAEKIYCGTGRAVPTQFGELMKVSFHKDDINKMVQYIKQEGGDWVNLVLKEKREKVEGKPTHYLEIDTWKPEPRQEQAAQPPVQSEPATSNEPEGDGLPF
jgi:hypothetical protein